MKAWRYFVVVLLVIGCCNPSRGGSAGPAGGLRPKKGRNERKKPTSGGGAGGEGANEQPPVVDEDPPPPAPPVPEKPRARKPQFYVNGPLPIAPPLATKERGERERGMQVMSSGTRTVSAMTRNSVAGRNRLPDNEKSILLHAHNEFRAMTTNPTAANIVQLVSCRPLLVFLYVFQYKR